jgi:hypothetical protein
MTVKTRYMMKSKKGEYVESTTRSKLEELRASDSRFKYARITHGLQAWSDIIKLNVIYPAYTSSRYEFILHNRELVD